jgi:hypothetical protein
MCPPRIVYVAAECPVPSQVPISPDYRVDDLPETATAKTIIEMYVLDLETCQNHTDKLETLLNAYGTEYKTYKTRNPPTPN